MTSTDFKTLKRMKYHIEIKRLREKHGLTQDELARAAKMRPQNISNIENGLRKPSETLFVRIIEAMGYTLKKKIVKLKRF